MPKSALFLAYRMAIPKRFLISLSSYFYIGDGEFEIVLTEKISKDCMVSTDWSLAEILRCCDGVYDDSGDFIADTLDESDFAIHKAE